MKKITLSVYVLAVAVILLSSCSRFSDVSLLKRHYRSGYYVETCSASKPSQKTKAESQESNQQAAITPVDKGTQQKQSEFRRITPVNKNIDIAERVENKESQIKKSETVLRSFEAPVETNETSRKISNESKILNLKQAYDGGEHHSALGGLLWLIIVVLLILFLLNFILTLNLGSLVYIILVVALILLLFRLIGML